MWLDFGEQLRDIHTGCSFGNFHESEGIDEMFVLWSMINGRVLYRTKPDNTSSSI